MQQSLMRLLSPLAASLALLLSPGPAQEPEIQPDEVQAEVHAAPPPPALRVLFLGNSYTEQNKLPRAVQALAASARLPLEIEVESRTPGGCTFERHWIAGRSVDLIREGGWDVVVLQEQSRLPLTDPLLMHRNGKKLIAEARKAGARPLLFMTWARRGELEMTEGLEAAYRGLAKQAGAEVAPVGLAWREALEEKPHWELHRPDGSHPNQRGTYLAACVLLGWIADVDPRSLGDVGLRELVAEEMVFLHAVAARYIPPAAVLPIPAELEAASVGPTRVTLKWRRFESRPDGLRVQRRLATEEEAPYTVVAEVAGNATRHTDSHLEPDTAYEYRFLPVHEEKRLALKASGAERKLKLPVEDELRASCRLELAAEGGPVLWQIGEHRLEVEPGAPAFLQLPAGAGAVEGTAAVTGGVAATGFARLVPSERTMRAIPPLRVLTEPARQRP